MKILNALLIIYFFCALAKAQSPNILLVHLDDKAFAYKDYTEHTPSIKSLETKSLRLENFYSPNAKNIAVELLFGKYISNIKNIAIAEDIDISEISVAKTLNGLGYASAYIGKWHNAKSAMPSSLGFDLFYGLLDSDDKWPYDWQMKAVLAGKLKTNDIKNPVLSLMLNSNIIELPTRQNGLLAKFTKETLNFIDKSCAKEKPFFIYLNYATSYAEEVALQKFFPEQAEDKVEKYYQSLDYNFTKILDDLEERELLENTLIIFTSRSHNALKASENPKNLVPEALHKLRAFVYNPKLFKEPKSLDGVVCTIDVAKFIVDCARQGKGENSMLGYFLGNQACDDSPFLYYGMYREVFAMRKGNLKVLLPKEKREIAIELYDLSKDPNELSNLAELMPEKAQELRKQTYALDAKQPKVLNAQEQSKKDKSSKEKAKELEKQKKKALKEEQKALKEKSKKKDK